MSTFEQAWASEEQAQTYDSSMSQDEMIAEFHRLDEIVKESSSRRREIGMALAGLAYAKKGTQNTVHLQSTGGRKVDVQFGTQTEYLRYELMEVSKLIGAEKFDELFETKIEFKGKLRALKNFLNTVWPDERLETAKKMIQDATVTKDKQPYVSIV